MKPRHLARRLFLVAGLAALLGLPPEGLAQEPPYPGHLAWLPASSPGPGPTSLEVDPSNSEHLFAGNRFAGLSSWQLESTDGGLSWSQAAPACPTDLPCYRKFDPSHPATLYATTYDWRLFRHEGGTWRRIDVVDSASGVVSEVVIDPADSRYLYGSGVDLYRSTDRGETWSVALPWSPWSSRSSPVVDPSGSGVLLVPSSNSWGGRCSSSLLRSTDHGSTWKAVPPGPGHGIAFDPGRPGLVHSGGWTDCEADGRVWRSTDSGGSWTSVEAPPGGRRLMTVTGGGDVFVVGAEGVYRTSRDGGPWLLAAWGYPFEQVPWQLVSLDAEGRRLLLSTEKDGLYRVGDISEAAPRSALLPAVVEAIGLHGSRFTTGLSLFNAADAPTDVELVYTAASATGSSGSGTVPLTLAPRQQLLLDDATSFLRLSGLPIPPAGSGPAQVGSLGIVSRSGSENGQVAAVASIRTPSGAGHAGTPLASLPTGSLPADRLVLGSFGPREGERRNLAVVNGAAAGAISLSVCLVGTGGRRCFAEGLGPGQWTQWSDAWLGRDWQWVEVSRTAGDSPWTAYVTVVDDATNDGSVVGPVSAEAVTIPVVVEAGGFRTDLFLLNPGDAPELLQLSWMESLSSGRPRVLELEVELGPNEAREIEGVVDHLRRAGAPVGPVGTAYAGILQVWSRSGRPPLAWARTRIPAEGGGSYGVSYAAVADRDLATSEAWIAGLLPREGSRSSVAFYAPGTETLRLAWDLLPGDGEDRAPILSGTFDLAPRQWRQVLLRPDPPVTNAVLRVRKVSGRGPFGAYGVVNDGAVPGEGTGDGTWLPMVAAR
ncbi:MAG: hypothetical protein EDX89_00080 [Acidobacteria bacterium]|nr:MAG: hypothetical protein EDX89_00080 [Acidobacteriota bacterium]MCE7958513.1 hypothetical protein [Acidobacteria bacterium ACB2]